jgi:hypothetical protein
MTEKSEDQIYQYIKGLSQNPSKDAITAFYDLFWNGSAPNSEVEGAYNDLLKDQGRNKDALLVLNRCFYTLLNPWHLNSENRHAINTLIEVVEELGREEPPNTSARLLQKFAESEQFFSLKDKLAYL